MLRTLKCCWFTHCSTQASASNTRRAGLWQENECSINVSIILSMIDFQQWLAAKWRCSAPQSWWSQRDSLEWPRISACSYLVQWRGNSKNAEQTNSRWLTNAKGRPAASLTISSVCGNLPSTTFAWFAAVWHQPTLSYAYCLLAYSFTVDRLYDSSAVDCGNKHVPPLLTLNTLMGSL